MKKQQFDFMPWVVLCAIILAGFAIVDLLLRMKGL